MNHVRVIMTETGANVIVERIIQGRCKKTVEQRTRQQLQSIIEKVLRDSPQACCDDIDEALQHGYWWTDLGSGEFTVVVLEPQHVDRADPLVVEDHDSLDLLHEHLRRNAFVILVHNADNEVESQFEAWAYNGPLNFDLASPIRFGLGADPVQALTALDNQLGMPSA